MLLSLLTSCKYFIGDNCNNTLPITGKYYNDYDKKAKHLLILKEDGTFEQLFEKDTILKRNSGTWKFFDESCSLYFEELKFLQNVPKGYIDDKLYERPAIHRTNNIYFIDHYDVSFYRLKD